MNTPKILAINGSLRRASLNKKVLQVVVEGARKAEAEIEFIDLKEMMLPIYDDDFIEENGFPETAAILQQKLINANGLIIATPEYNGSITGGLKNFFDWTSRAQGDVKMGDCYRDKVAAILSASPGSFGGLRCLGHLRTILSVLGVQVLPEEFAVAFANKSFDDNGVFKDEKMLANLQRHGANVAQTIRKLS